MNEQLNPAAAPATGAAPINEEVAKLGTRIERVDQLTVQVMARRIRLAMKVAESKGKRREKIYRAQAEEKRLKKVAEWARENSVSPDFAQAALYGVIGESCKQQMIIMENLPNGGAQTNGEGSEIIVAQDEAERDIQLRQNLLYLGRHSSETYDECYGSKHFATRQQLAYEHDVLTNAIQSLDKRSVLLDLGCATGRETLMHAQKFHRVIGYDISPEMIMKAESNALKAGIKNAQFKVHDLEQGLGEIPSESVSLVYMNLGTASEVRNTEHMLEECRRVLKAGGRFMFSFHNAESISCQAFIPWPLNLVVEIDLERNCLEVLHEGKVFPVYARAYKPDRDTFQDEILPEHMVITSFTTYPTISSILPPDLFEKRELRELFAHIDKILTTDASSDRFGSYIVMSGRKTS